MTDTPTLPRKPKFGESCNGCGYCCTAQPCQLAQEFLTCHEGPCVALETHAGLARCGLVRNPLGYLFKAVHPQAIVPLGDEAPAEGYALSSQFAAVLGLGQGCDAEDDEDSTAWPVLLRATRN